MATPIRSSMTDNSSKDNTGDAVNGAEVDSNPNTIADILDGTTNIDMNGASTPYLHFANSPYVEDHKSGRIQVYNDSGATIAADSILYVSGYDSSSGLYEISKAIVTTSSATTFYGCLVLEDAVANGGTGYACVYRMLTGKDTSGLTAGRPVYLSTTAGGWTGTRPSAQNRVQVIGQVGVVDASAGRVAITLPGTIVPWAIGDQI